MSKKNRLLGITFISGNTEFFPPRIIKYAVEKTTYDNKKTMTLAMWKILILRPNTQISARK